VVSNGIGDLYRLGTPSSYLTDCSDQLSLVIPLRVGTISTSDSLMVTTRKKTASSVTSTANVLV